MTIVAGIDFGTASVRVSIVHCERGRLGSGVAEYAVGREPLDPDRATQKPADQFQALELAFRSALASAGREGRNVEAIAIDTTGSTILPLDAYLQPLADYYLWCDHRAWREAAEITEKAQRCALPALEWCGGKYSAEWGFSKVLHWLRRHPAERSRFYTAAENCDFVVGTLCGLRDSRALIRSVCAMGHKWMWNEKLGGLPPEEFLRSVDPLLSGLRESLQGPYLKGGTVAGELSTEWAKKLGIRPGTRVSAGALDAHWDAIGAGCRVGDVVNVIGTSSCIMALTEKAQPIPGISGVVEGSVAPDKVGIEAGLSAVGDLFEAIARRACLSVSALASQTKGYRAGQTGLTRFAWDNGDRSVLANPSLSGITLGWRLNHTAADELFAAIEGTAFHTRIILDRLEEHDVDINRIINAGGIPQRNDVLNRVYAGVLGKEVLVPSFDTTSIGSAIFAFLSAGTFDSVEEAQGALCPSYHTVEPSGVESRIYQDLFVRFRELYYSLGSTMTASTTSTRNMIP